MALPNYQDIRPASEDPLGDPADQLPQGDVLSADQDPLGDPAFQEFQGRWGQSDFSDDEANGFYDRFARQPYFEGAQSDFLSQIPPQEFEQQAQQAAYHLPPQQRQEVADGLLGALGSQGIDIGQLAGMLGLGSTTADGFGVDDLARLLGWTQQINLRRWGRPWPASPGSFRRWAAPQFRAFLRRWPSAT